MDRTTTEEVDDNRKGPVIAADDGAQIEVPFGGQHADLATKQTPETQAETTADCEQCGTEFKPRHTSGGSPQRYCSADCRKASHKSSQRSQRPTTNAPASPASPASSPASPASHETRLNDNETLATAADTTPPKGELLLAAQSQITAERDEHGNLILRQPNWPDDDSVIVIHADYADQFIDRLTDIMGIASVP